MRSRPTLAWRAIRQSITCAREVFPPFGRQSITTTTTTEFLRRSHVVTQLAELPPNVAAVLSPRYGRMRSLSLARHVPRLARKLVLLHEVGHIYQRTAGTGVRYDAEEWRSPAELGADTFAAIALVPTIGIDLALGANVWMRGVEDDVVGMLMDYAEGMWDFERALVAARHRIMVRERFGL